MQGNIRFNGISSDDLGVDINNVVINNATPIIVTQSIPYSNHYFDFSAINGAVKYEQREIIITISFTEYSREKSNAIKQSINSWLITPNKEKLEIDYRKGYVLARVSSIEEEESISNENILIITFIADPFFNVGEYGADIWDEFNFLNDYSENDNHTISGTNIITVYNSGMPTVPIIISTDDMNCKFENKNFNLQNGRNTIPFIYLKNGKNEFTITGNGEVRFIFEKIEL